MDPSAGTAVEWRPGAGWREVDHVRSVDKRRVCRVFGRLSSTELRSIDEGLRLYLGVESDPDAELAPFRNAP